MIGKLTVPLIGIGCGEGLEVGVQRHLRIDDEVAVTHEVDDQMGRIAASGVEVPTWVEKSQCFVIPASSTTRSNCISPHRPRKWGVCSAFDSAWVCRPSRCEACCMSRTCSVRPA